ncbi:amino acid ABC transporter permease [Tomitella cavernea]|uniref:Amino acid ABC transporter permease n=1 Tax=Tomitella cavernea TaxID=1387982 RepID=A0ABP9CUZ0_9ACTN|nr:amino acid ABC transporter permease [Tomitella cavernea]
MQVLRRPESPQYAAGDAAVPSDDLQVDKVASLPVVRAKYPWRVAAGLLILFLLALFVRDAWINKAWDWETFGSFVFDQSIMSAIVVTLELTAMASVFGFAGGMVIAMMRMSGNPVLATTSWAFTWLFRSIPLVVQLLIWGNLAYLYPTLGIHLPFGPAYQTETVGLISSMGAAVIGLSLHQAAYAAEIVRSGLLSVDQGQIEAANALGIPGLRQFRRIILPQAMRTIIPTAANETISLLKQTSVVFVLAIGDLFYRVQVIYGINNRIIPLLLVATFWYVVFVTIMSIGQFYIERYFARGAVRNLPPTPMQRLRTWVSGAIRK